MTIRIRSSWRLRIPPLKNMKHKARQHIWTCSKSWSFRKTLKRRRLSLRCLNNATTISRRQNPMPVGLGRSELRAIHLNLVNKMSNTKQKKDGSAWTLAANRHSVMLVVSISMKILTCCTMLCLNKSLTNSILRRQDSHWVLSSSSRRSKNSLSGWKRTKWSTRQMLTWLRSASAVLPRAQMQRPIWHL